MITLSAKPVAEAIQKNIRERTQKFVQRYHRAPKLSVVLVGEDPASVIYTTRKGQTAVVLGMEHETIALAADSDPHQVQEIVSRLNANPNVDGILIQRPLPKSFNEDEVLYWVSPEKDVDAFHPTNAGKLFLGMPSFQPCTPAGVMALLEHYQINPAGKIACVIGRSSIVGRPMQSLLLHADATVLHCHSKTPDLRAMTRQAEILVVAAGKMGMIDRSYIREGAVVIDVGIHRNSAGKVVGDVIFDEVATIASAMTPVPGGVGPMTITLLMRNTIRAAELREERKEKASVKKVK
jgi:methylenetetrahydrofolate dehydrogenase (NADP+)/methenyltetrahydrofolate cyclohydrolase